MKQWGIKYVILVEDSYAGGPSSITIKMEYLFAFGGVGQKVSIFVPCVTQRNEDVGLVQPLPSLVFNPLSTFHRHRSYRKNLRSQH